MTGVTRNGRTYTMAEFPGMFTPAVGRHCGKTATAIDHDTGPTDDGLIPDNCVFISAGEFRDVAYEPEPLPKLSPFHQTRQARGKGKYRRDWEK